VGLVIVAGQPQVPAGTAWILYENVVVTPLYVVQQFVSLSVTKAGSGTLLKRAFVSFSENPSSDQRQVYELSDLLYLQEGAGGFALLRVLPNSNAPVPSPLPLAPRSVVHIGQHLAVIGFNFPDKRNDEKLVEAAFAGKLGMKLISPGTALSLADEPSMFWHNCPTLGGSSGSPIFDLHDGSVTVIGIHYGGAQGKGNFALSASVLASALVHLRAANKSSHISQPPHCRRSVLTLWRRMKLFLVGDGKAGKTSILRWLKGEPFVAEYEVTDVAKISTLEVFDWQDAKPDTMEAVQTIQPEDSTIVESAAPSLSTVLHVWDFAGQEVYYVLHHLFLSSEAIFLLVIDISQPMEIAQLDRVKFWLYSIRARAECAPILIIGTHEDEVPSKATVKQRLRTVYNWLSESNILLHPEQPKHNNKHMIAVSCKSTDDQSVSKRDALRKYIMDLAELRLRRQKPQPGHLVAFYRQLLRTLQTSLSPPGAISGTLSRQEVVSMAREYQMSEPAVDSALKHFHELGFLLYYTHSPELREIVFAHPQPLIDALKTVVSVRIEETLATTEVDDIEFGPDAPPISSLPLQASALERWNLAHDGRLSEKMLTQLWNRYSPATHKQLRELLQQFELAYLDETGDFIVPCLIRNKLSSHRNSLLGRTPMLFQCTIGPVPPLGFSTRFLARLARLTLRVEGRSVHVLYADGCLLRFGNCWIQVRCTPDMVELQVQRSNSTDWNNVVQILLKEVTALARSYRAPCTLWGHCVKCSELLLLQTVDQPGTFSCAICLATPPSCSPLFKFVALKESFATLLQEGYPSRINDIKRKWDALYHNVDTPLPPLPATSVDPSVGVQGLLDYFGPGREHLLWKLFDVLDAMQLLPPEIQSYQQIEEWAERPVNTRS
jgi:GTPase SAR1 family protein